MWRKFFAVVLCVILPAQPVCASWLSWASAGCTCAGAVCAVIPAGATQVIGGVCGMVQLVGLAIDVVQTCRLPAWQWSQATPPPYGMQYYVMTDPYGVQHYMLMPIMAGATPPPTLPPQAKEMMAATFKPFTPPPAGSWSSGLIGATNVMISTTNTCLAAARDPAASDNKVANCVYNVALAVAMVVDEYEHLGGDIAITQDMMDWAQDDFDAYGLPGFEVDILTAAGLSPTCISALGVYCAVVPFTCGDTTVGAILDAMPKQIWPMANPPPAPAPAPAPAPTPAPMPAPPPGTGTGYIGPH